jgi:uncharacterized protein with FMN-binding domain
MDERTKSFSCTIEVCPDIFELAFNSAAERRAKANNNANQTYYKDMDEPAERTRPATTWLKNNLVGLGSAAVFTVYSAGYFRTRDAAQRFAGEAVQRRTAVAVSPETNVRAAAPRADVHGKSETNGAVIHPSSSAKAPAPLASSPGRDAAVAPAPPVEAAASSPAVMPAAPATVPAAPTVPPATPAPAPAAAPPAAAPPAAAPPATDSAASPPEKKSDNKLKDGVFYGWGTSRHGDIQASVEIENGRIVGAYISQCRTQYSCSWVSALPGQVVQRQSAEVDYVSGATQSSNAFYYGVVEALKKAKAF